MRPRAPARKRPYGSFYATPPLIATRPSFGHQRHLGGGEASRVATRPSHTHDVAGADRVNDQAEITGKRELAGDTTSTDPRSQRIGKVARGGHVTSSGSQLTVYRRPARISSADKDQLARIQVSENASIAVVMVCPAISRGIGLPRSVVPFTVMVAFSQPTKRLGMWCFPVADFSGGNAKQNGSPSPLQVSCTSRSSALTVSV
jgi:hypothetical protein